MAALVVSGAPVSVLVDHGLAEKVVEKLLEAGIGTVEKLGAMTPEQLEEIPGIGPKTVEMIQLAVNSYYAQFEEAPAPGIETQEASAEDIASPEAGESVNEAEDVSAATETGSADTGTEPAATESEPESSTKTE